MSAVKTKTHPVIILVVMLTLSGLTACSSTPGSKIAPNSEAAEINAQLGLAYVKEGMPDVARIKLDKALAQNPRSPTVHTALGLFNEDLMDFKAAEKHFKKAAELATRSDKGNGSEHNNLGRFYCSQQRYSESDHHFALAFKDKYYTTKEITYTNAAVCKIDQELLDKAGELLRAALQLNKEYPPALYYIAQVYYDQGLFPLAKTYLERYFDTGRKSVEGAWLAYRLERKIGTEEEAARYAEDLKKNYPDSEQTAKLYHLEIKGGQ